MIQKRVSSYAQFRFFEVGYLCVFIYRGPKLIALLHQPQAFFIGSTGQSFDNENMQAQDDD